MQEQRSGPQHSEMHSTPIVSYDVDIGPIRRISCLGVCVLMQVRTLFVSLVLEDLPVSRMTLLTSVGQWDIKGYDWRLQDVCQSMLSHCP